jgi:hypothetical protein
MENAAAMYIPSSEDNVSTNSFVELQGSCNRGTHEVELSGVVDVVGVVADAGTLPPHPLLPVFPRVVAHARKPFQIVRQVVLELTELRRRRVQKRLQKVSHGFTQTVNQDEYEEIESELRRSRPVESVDGDCFTS